MNPYLLVLVLYSLLLIGAGLFFSRQVRHGRDFFVADRRLGPGLLFSTLLAANIGAGSTIGAAGLGYRLGLSAWWWVGSAGIGSLALALWVGPRIRELAAGHSFLTVGDFLEFRYDRRVRTLCSLFLWLGTLAILAGQLIAISWILAVVAGTSRLVGSLLGGGIVVVYFSLGGLKGTARINLVQLLVKGAGFFLALPVALASQGGWSGLQTRLAATAPQGYFSLTGIGASSVLAYLVMLAPAFIISPGLLQKIYGARDTRAVRLGTGINALVLMLYAFVPVLLGMTAAAAFPHLTHPELALPRLMTELLPFGLGALLLAAVFSAEISSADAVLFMLSTSLARDLYETLLGRRSEERLLAASRWSTVAAGALGIVLAVWLPSVIAALALFYTFLSVTFFAPVILGLYTRGARSRACLAAVVLSVLLTAGVHLATAGRGLWLFSPAACGILLSLLILGGQAFLARRGPG